MVASRNFWFGVIVGVGGVYVYHKYAMRKSGATSN